LTAGWLRIRVAPVLRGLLGSLGDRDEEVSSLAVPTFTAWVTGSSSSLSRRALGHAGVCISSWNHWMCLELSFSMDLRKTSRHCWQPSSLTHFASHHKRVIACLWFWQCRYLSKCNLDFCVGMLAWRCCDHQPLLHGGKYISLETGLTQVSSRPSPGKWRSSWMDCSPGYLRLSFHHLVAPCPLAARRKSCSVCRHMGFPRCVEDNIPLQRASKSGRSSRFN
jgi:hypothetical protein